MSTEIQRAYQRGYNRGRARASDRANRALEIARGYRAKAALQAPQPRCDTCDRWKRGHPELTVLWGFCRGDFEYPEPGMWADTLAGERNIDRKVVTHEHFGCVNWIPTPADAERSEVTATDGELSPGISKTNPHDRGMKP